MALPNPFTVVLEARREAGALVDKAWRTGDGTYFAKAADVLRAVLPVVSEPRVIEGLTEDIDRYEATAAHWADPQAATDEVYRRERALVEAQAAAEAAKEAAE